MIGLVCKQPRPRAITEITAGMKDSKQCDQEKLAKLIKQEFEGKGKNHSVTPEKSPEIFEAFRGLVFGGEANLADASWQG